MTISDQKAFDAILGMTQNLLRRATAKSGETITPEIIDRELSRVEIIMEEDFALVNREAILDELIRRSSHTVGRNATLRDDSTTSSPVSTEP